MLFRSHMQCDLLDVLNMGWDLLAVMHPPCTRLCNSGVRWLHTPPPRRTKEQMWQELDDGCAFFSACWNAPIERVAVENPVMHRHAKKRIKNFKPAAQTVQPWWFGDKAFKGIGLYLRNLPELVATNRLTPPKKSSAEHKKWSAIHRASPGPNRWKIRSKTFPGPARAMAEQWGDFAAAGLLTPDPQLNLLEMM